MKKFLDLIAIEVSASFILCNYKKGVSTLNDACPFECVFSNILPFVIILVV